MNSLEDFCFSFDQVVGEIRQRLVSAPIIDTGEWQAIQGAPQSKMSEIEDVSFSMRIPTQIKFLQIDVKPNLPWAEDHFLERVSGVPWNPPPSSDHWPFAVQGNAAHKQDFKFSHTYPERLWPNRIPESHPKGIRFPFGCLDNVISLLKNRPHTRQAYIPIWFPEDGWAAEHGLRVPCTLGYHVMQRNGELKIVYYIRSCDFLRHFRDDVYMAARLCQWIAEKINSTPGQLVMHISSMHVFESDVSRLRYVVEHE